MTASILHRLSPPMSRPSTIHRSVSTGSGHSITFESRSSRDCMAVSLLHAASRLSREKFESASSCTSMVEFSNDQQPCNATRYVHLQAVSTTVLSLQQGAPSTLQPLIEVFVDSVLLRSLADLLDICTAWRGCAPSLLGTPGSNQPDARQLADALAVSKGGRAPASRSAVLLPSKLLNCWAAGMTL